MRKGLTALLRPVWALQAQTSGQGGYPWSCVWFPGQDLTRPSPAPQASPEKLGRKRRGLPVQRSKAPRPSWLSLPQDPSPRRSTPPASRLAGAAWSLPQPIVFLRDPEPDQSAAAGAGAVAMAVRRRARVVGGGTEQSSGPGAGETVCSVNHSASGAPVADTGKVRRVAGGGYGLVRLEAGASPELRFRSSALPKQ